MADIPINVPLRITGTFNAIKSARNDLARSGFNSEGSIYLVAHSLGGVTVQDFAVIYPDFAKGIILLGSALLRKYADSLSVPILSINGELDAQVISVFLNFSLSQ